MIRAAYAGIAGFGGRKRREALPSEKGTGIVIATVRIAPVEQWCKQGKRDMERMPGFSRLPGTAVQIFPQLMRKGTHESGEEGRYWPVPEDVALRIRELTGADWTDEEAGRITVCEHMLEMD